MAKKKKRRSAPQIAPERLSELVQQLDDGALEAPSNDEMAALCVHLEKAEEIDALLHLLNVSDSNKQRKSVKQSLFRLKQRGLAVPDLRDRTAGIRLTPSNDGAEDFPVLMYEPHSEGTRFFYLPYQSGRQLLLVHAKFEQPQGLKELKSSDISRKQLRTTIQNVLSNVQIEDTPVIVETDAAMRDRKLWEIGHYVRTGRASSDVDKDLCAVLRWSEDPPPHPVEAIDLDAVEPISFTELDKEARFLAPLFYSSLWEELSNEVDAVSDSPLVLSEATEAERIREVQQKVVAKWLEQWDHVALTEILLDAALFRALAGDLSVAKRFRDVVIGPGGEALQARLTHFLEQLVIHLFEDNIAEPETEPNAEENTSPGGIIIP